MEIQLWKKRLDPYELAVKELTVKFEHLIQEHKQQGLYSPIEQVTGRVKSVSSILNKMKKKKIEIDEMEEKVEDIAGIRIICQFVEDIQKVVEIIRARNDMEVKEERDYITNMKDTGGNEKNSGGDSDSDTGNEFLVYDRTFPAVQV